MRPFEGIYREDNSQESQGETGQQPSGAIRKAGGTADANYQCHMEMQRAETGKNHSAHSRRRAVVQQSAGVGVGTAQMMKARTIDPRFQSCGRPLRAKEKALKHLNEATIRPRYSSPGGRERDQALLKTAAQNFRFTQPQCGGAGGHANSSNWITGRSQQRGSLRNKEAGSLNKARSRASSWRAKSLKIGRASRSNGGTRSSTGAQRPRPRRSRRRFAAAQPLSEEERRAAYMMNCARWNSRRTSRMAEARDQLDRTRYVSAARTALERSGSQALSSGRGPQRNCSARDDSEKKYPAVRRRDAADAAPKPATWRKTGRLASTRSWRRAAQDVERLRRNENLVDQFENKERCDQSPQSMRSFPRSRSFEHLCPSSLRYLRRPAGNIENSLNLTEEL